MDKFDINFISGIDMGYHLAKQFLVIDSSSTGNVLVITVVIGGVY